MFDSTKPEYQRCKNIYSLDNQILPIDIDVVLIDLSLATNTPDLSKIISNVEKKIEKSFQLLLFINNKYFYWYLKSIFLNRNKITGYNLVSIKSLLRKLGFNVCRVFCSKSVITENLNPLPELSNMCVSERGNMVVNSLLHEIKESIKNTKIGKYTWPVFLVDARKNEQSSNVCKNDYLAELLDFEIIKLIAGNLGNDVLLVEEKNTGKEFVLRKHNNDEGEMSCRINYEVLKKYSNKLFDYIPEAVLFSEKYKVSIESRLPGDMLIRYDNFSCDVLKQEHKWLDYQLSNLDVLARTKEQYVKYFHEQLNNMFNLSEEITNSLNLIINKLAIRLEGEHLPCAPIHGDYKISNFLFNKNHDLTGVIDWDHFREKALPVYDHLTMVLYMIIHDKEGRYDNLVFFQNLWNDNIDKIYKEYLVESINKLNIPMKLYKEVLICFWLCYISWRKVKNYNSLGYDYVNESIVKFNEYLDI